jgi:hypothetical protein
MNIAVLDPKDDEQKFVINMKKYEAIGVMTTYTSREIHFIQVGSIVLIKSQRR